MVNKEIEKKDEIDTIDIIPKKINIMVETNIEGEAPFQLTYDKIYNPVKSSTLPQPKKPDYPYFVPNIKYSETVLMNYLLKDYSLILLSFFDKKYFSNMIQDFMKENKTENKTDNETDNGQENVNHNIFLTLLFLFPMRYPRPANINTSYTKYICKDGNKIYTDLTNIYQSGKNTISALLRNMRDIETSVREYSYINSSKGQATVTQIVWLNDVLNNPKYRELIDLLIQYESWVKNKRITIKNDIDTAISDLISSAKNSITDDDIKLINDQQNIAYSKKDFIEDILTTVFEYIYYDEGTETDIDRKNELTKIIDTIKRETIGETAINKIKKYIDKPGGENVKNVKIDTDKLIVEIFEVVFDINVTEKNKRRNDSKQKHVILDYFKFNNDIKTPSTILRNKEENGTFKEIDFSDIIDNNYKSIPIPIQGNFLNIFREKLYEHTKFKSIKTNLTNDLKEYVEKYNRNLVKSNIGYRSEIAYVDIDIKIKKAVEELKSLNNALNNNVANDENFKKIVNAVDSLKTFFTDQSIKENRLTEVSTIKQNFEKILKKTNIIKTLKYIEENIINSSGINLNYKSESNEFNTVLKSELEKEKYSYFMNTVETINKNFLNIQTTNQNLENIIKDYFNNRNKDLITTLIEPAKTAMNVNKIDDDCKYHYMETGVSITTSSAKKLYEYEINIYMEVVIGKVDYQTQNNIKCDYRDEKLVAYFNRDSTNVNKFEIVKSKAINLNKNKEPTQNNQKNQNNQNNQKKTKGGKTTRKKKYVQYNKRYTSKRR